MKKGSWKPNGSHLQSIIERPHSRAETIADTGEATARSTVCFDHKKGFTGALCDFGRVDIRLYEFDSGGVIEEVGEDVLGGGVGGWGVAVVFWITDGELGYAMRKGEKDELFYGEGG